MNTRSQALGTAAICALLVVPRIARLLHPQIWIEDESYLTGALMLSHGWLPYRDFPLPHYPLLEALLAAIFRLARASIRTAEITTQVAALAGSLLVFALGRRLDGLFTGAVAGTVFATSGLLFRYHLFEREVFIVVPVLAAVLLASQTPRSATTLEPFPDAKAAGIGALLFVALAIKLSAIAALVAVGLQLWLTHGRRAAAQAVGIALALLAVLTVVLAAVFGTDFIVQVFVFRAVHAAFPSLFVKLTEMRLTMDVSLACGAAGVALILWTHRARVWAAPLLQLAVGFAVLVVLNPTYWAHTGIELLPWLSLGAGFLVASVVRALRRPAGRRRRAGAGIAPWKAYACAIAAAALLFGAVPLRNLNWEAGDGSTDGFGYRDRREIAAIAAYLDAHTEAQALVTTPPIIAFAADRRELVPYPEIAGVVDEIGEIVRRRGYLAALGDPDLRHGSFWDSVDASRERIAPQIASALREHRIAALVNDSSDDLTPIQFVDVPQAELEADGYQLESAFAHYDVWLRR